MPRAPNTPMSRVLPALGFKGGLSEPMNGGEGLYSGDWATRRRRDGVRQGMSTEISSRGRDWDLRDYVKVVRRRAWVIVGAGMVAAVVATGYSATQSKVYEATADVL